MGCFAFSALSAWLSSAKVAVIWVFGAAGLGAGVSDVGAPTDAGTSVVAGGCGALVQAAVIHSHAVRHIER